MAIEYMTFEEVLEELGVDEEEINRLVSHGELPSFREGNSIKFKRDDVLNLKRGRETEPTIILTDSDQEMGIAESSDELILDDSSTADTVLNVGDIMTGAGSDEIVFDTTEEFAISPHDSDPEAAIPTVEVPRIEEDLGLAESDSDAALVEVSASSAEHDAFDVIDVEDSQESAEIQLAPSKPSSRKVSVSARMAAMSMEQQKGHALWTTLLTFSAIAAMSPLIILFHRMRNSEPAWLTDFAESISGMVGSIAAMF